MYKICLAVVVFGCVAVSASSEEVENQDAQEEGSRFFRPGVWFPINFPGLTPAAGAGGSTANVCTGCCRTQCVGGTCTAPSTCSNAPVAATACFATAVSTTCTNIATCKTMATAPCTATTADCVSTAICAVPAG